MTTWSKYFQHKYHRAINGWAAPPLDKDKPPNCPDSTDAGSWHLSKCPAQCSLAHQYIRRKGWAWFPLCWTANDPNFHAQFMLILSILNAVIFVQLSIFPLLWSRLISISIFKLGIIHPFITDNYETMFIADIRTCSRSIIWYWPRFFLLFGKINIQNESWWSQFISTSISGTGTAQHSYTNMDRSYWQNRCKLFHLLISLSICFTWHFRRAYSYLPITYLYHLCKIQ